MKLTSFIATSLLLLGIGSASFAYQAKIDPKLRQELAKVSDGNQSMVVIVQFRGGVTPPENVWNRKNHTQVQKAMMKETFTKGEDLRKFLVSHGESLQNTKALPLWIINGMALNVPARMVETLASNPTVQSIRANGTVKLIAPKRLGVVSDRFLAANKFTYGLEKLQVPELRQSFSAITGKDVLVGILDTGIDASHPDLKDHVVMWKDFTPAGKKQPIDEYGHGTHVAGTISGGSASGTSIGVAPEAKLVIGRIFDANGSTTDAIILQAMQWIADPDGNPATNDFPVLVSNSWGGGEPSISDDPKDDAMCRAVTSWSKLGILPVFAAGNSGSSPETINLPGGCPDALSVGATDSKDAIASFSSRGAAKWKTGTFIAPIVSAPGVGVISTVPGGKYEAYSGTSMATPHVAGLATLLYQAAPNAPIAAIKETLASTALDLGKAGQDNDFGWGRVNAFEATKKLKKLMGH